MWILEKHFSDVFASDKVVWTLVLLLVSTWVAWQYNYNRSRRRFLELAKRIPGPLTLPFIGSIWYFIGPFKDILPRFFTLFQKYGPVVSVWAGNDLFVVISKPKDMQIVMNSVHALDKPTYLKKYTVFLGEGLTTAPGPIWKPHRKMIAPTFNQKNLNGYVKIFSEQCQVLADQLKNKAGKGTFCIYDSVSRCTMDIFCETAMGIKPYSQTNSDAHLLSWCCRACEIVCTRIFNLFYQSDFIFNLTPMSKELNDLVAKGHAFTDDIIRKRREAYENKMKQSTGEFVFKENGSRDFLDQLFEYSNGGKDFTDTEIRDEVNAFLLAGSETTANTLSFVFVILGMFPEVQQRVYEEVMGALGPDEPVQSEDLGKFPYLERVLKETMRLYPIGPILPRMANQDIQLENHIIPSGSSIIMCIIQLHRDPEIWPDPLKFDPDRFLPEETAKRHPYSWLPFSGGFRNCIGTKYAYMLMKTAVSTVIRKYRLKTIYKDIEDMKIHLELVVKPQNGYKVSVELRE